MVRQQLRSLGRTNWDIGASDELAHYVSDLLADHAVGPDDLVTYARQRVGGGGLRQRLGSAASSCVRSAGEAALRSCAHHQAAAPLVVSACVVERLLASGSPCTVR
jgi:hypothetical protein